MKTALTDIESAASAWIARRDAGLTPAEEAEFAHWAADPRHAEALLRHERAWRIYDRPRVSGLGRAAVDAMRARLRARRRRRMGAAAFAAGLCAVFFWTMRSPDPVGAGTDGHVPATATVVRPEMRTLPDGSQVELRPGAEVAAEFDGGVRRVRLRRGEAHFQVARDAARPFVVTAEGVDIRAVGTAFSVDLASRRVGIIVTEGVVAVELPSTPSTSAAGEARSPSGPRTQAAMVKAGSQLVVNLEETSAPGDGPVAISEEDVGRRLAWRSPQLEFAATPLGEAIALMNRHGRTQLSLADASLASLEVTGLFQADNTEVFLRLLDKGLGIVSERKGAEILLRKK